MTTALAPQAATRRAYPALDGLRVFGALAVFVKHSSYATRLQYRPHWAWMNHFEVGPTLFFVLSAFLVYLPFARSHAGLEPVQRLGNFAWRRVLRVVPAYWVALTVLLLFVRDDSAHIFGVKAGGMSGVVEQFTFTQIYDPRHFFFGIAASYTLAVEVSFY